MHDMRYKCNNKHDPKIINLNKMAIPKKAYLLSFFSRHYHKIMKPKCKAHRYLSLFSCNCVSHMTNYVNFKLSKDAEKNPGPTQYNTDHHELIIRPYMQNHSSTMQLNYPISSENLMQSRLGQLRLQSINVGGQVIVSLDLYHINYMAIATIICVYVLLGETKNFQSFLSLMSVLEGGGVREVNYIYAIPCSTGPR